MQYVITKKETEKNLSNDKLMIVLAALGAAAAVASGIVAFLNGNLSKDLLEKVVSYCAGGIFEGIVFPIMLRALCEYIEQKKKNENILENFETQIEPRR